MKSTIIYLVRHAKSEPSEKIPARDWPLNLEGIEQAQKLVSTLSKLSIDTIYSSPFPRSIKTLEPTAKALNLRINLQDNLRERKLCDGKRDDWQVLLKQSWEDFTFSLPNCESNNDCQKRIVNCVNGIVDKHEGKNIAAGSHGNAIGLFLNAMDSSFDFDAWKSLKNPDVIRINYNQGTPKIDDEFSFSL